MDPKSIDGLKKHSDKFIDEKPPKSYKIYVKDKRHPSLALEAHELHLLESGGVLQSSATKPSPCFYTAP